MVNSVMLGCIEHVFQRPEVTHNFRVYPKLIQQVEMGVDYHLSRRDEKGHRQIKRPASESLH